jgi:MFS family permease
LALPASAIALPFAGALLDRFGVRRVLIPSTAAYGVLLCAMYFLTSSLTHYYLMLLLMFVLGCGCGQIAFIRLLVAWFDTHKGLALAIALSGGGIAAIIAPIYTAWIVQTIGWREAYLTFGVITLLVSLPLLYFTIFNTPEEKGTYPDGMSLQGDRSNRVPISNVGLEMSAVVRRTAFWKLLVFFFLISLGQQGPFSQLVPVFVDKGISPTSAASIVSLLGIALITARLITGAMIDRIYAPAVIATFLGGCALGYLWLSTMPLTPTSAVVCTLLLGMALGVEYEAIGFLSVQYFGRRANGRIIGIMFSTYGVGAAISHFLAGRSFDLAATYDYVLLGGAILQMIAVFVILSLGKYPHFPVSGPEDAQESAANQTTGRPSYT